FVHVSFFFSIYFYLFFSMLPLPPTSTLFPYTTLFRSTNMAGGSSCIESGFYISVIENNGVEYRKLKDSHADTWLSFSNLLTWIRSEEHTSELQSRENLVCRLLLEKKKTRKIQKKEAET